MNCTKDMNVDHINHDTFDTRKNNLREATVSDNAKNRKKAINNTSGVVGVFYYDYHGYKKWLVNMKLKEWGRQKVIGRFNTKEEAVAFRKASEIKYFGEYTYNEEENKDQHKVS